MAQVKQELLGALKIAGASILATAASEVGPIEAAGLQALNQLIADLLAKATGTAAPAPQA